jgi:hypothetical protein
MRHNLGYREKSRLRLDAGERMRYGTGGRAGVVSWDGIALLSGSG